MPYCTVVEVKAVLQIDESETEWDKEILDCITSADGLVDGFLTPYSLSVPATAPENIKNASAHFAAWLFAKRRDPTRAAPFYTEAQKFVQVYIEAETEAESDFRVVNA